ncbi:MAG: hypothetical protein ABIE74_12860 [Pseudomonadota bacterium]
MVKDTKYELGKDALSYCGKCKMPLAHTITKLTAKGGVDRCECNTCKTSHKYRDPDKPVKAKGSTKRATKATISNEATWNEAISKAKGSFKLYEMSAKFAAGDLMEHSMFGKGVVKELIGYNKLIVIFEKSEKLLVHNRE